MDENMSNGVRGGRTPQAPHHQQQKQVICNTGGSELSTSTRGGKRTVVVTMAEIRLHGDQLGGLYPRSVTVRLLCGLRGNQLLGFKSVRFSMENGEARYTFEQRQTLQMSEQSIASGGMMKLVLLAPTAAAVDQVVASCEVNSTNSMLPVWVPIFSSAGQKSCCGQVSVSIDARGLPEDIFDDSETEGSLTPCLSVASNANLMRLTATGCKDDTPMPTPTAKLEQGTPAEAESEVPVAAEKLFAFPLPLPSGARPTLSFSWPLFLAAGVIAIAAIAAAMSARTSSFSASPLHDNRPPVVKMMNQTATPSVSTSTKSEPPPAAPPSAEFVTSSRRPNTLVVSAPHGQLVQIIDGQDGYCLHWRRGIFGGHARFAKCSDRSWWNLTPGASGLLKVERNGKCLLPKKCGETSSPLVLGSCDSVCAAGWNLNETGQLSRPVLGNNRKLQDSLSCLSRRKGGESSQRFPLPVFNKGKAFLSLCYMDEALSALSALSATASTTSRGLLSIKLIKYNNLVVAPPQPL